VPRGAFAWATRSLKQAVKIPVVASNRINAPEIAEEILARGDADMVSLARAIPRRRGLRAKAQSGRPRRHQHLHRLQPGLPRPLLSSASPRAAW
jgi:2,4-dienoyl-CoA reductase-like NADH-dependent reductase (Old Yellow Enzyme family)